MQRGNRVARPALGLALASWLVCVSGCSSRSALARAGVDLEVPAQWSPVPKDSRIVPGTPLAAWSGPSGSSLVVYTSLPIPEGQASALADQLATRLENLPGLRIVAAKTERIAGIESARVEVVAPGTGDALAPSGTGAPVSPSGSELVPTRRVMIGFIRPGDTLTLVWHAPEVAYASIEPQVEAMLKSLTVELKPADTSAY